MGEVRTVKRLEANVETSAVHVIKRSVPTANNEGAFVSSTSRTTDVPEVELGRTLLIAGEMDW